jgi:hypothetical protein
MQFHHLFLFAVHVIIIIAFGGLVKKNLTGCVVTKGNKKVLPFKG